MDDYFVPSPWSNIQQFAAGNRYLPNSADINLYGILLFVIVGLCVFFTMMKLWWRKQDDVPSIASLGRGSWALLHTTAAKYPHRADPHTQRAMLLYLNLFADFYPCARCSRHMKKFMQRVPPVATGRDELQLWLCSFHNDVNAKLGKRRLRCERENVNEIHARWGGGTMSCPEEMCNRL